MNDIAADDMPFGGLLAYMLECNEICAISCRLKLYLITNL